MTVEEMEVLIATQMRQQGFRKKKLTWYKNQEDVTIVFNIQKSQYSNDIWYYNYGIGINDFYPKQITDIQKCDICYRFEQALNHQIITADDLVRILQIWVDQYGSLEKLISQAHKGKLPAMTTKKCSEYLLNRYRNK